MFYLPNFFPKFSLIQFFQNKIISIFIDFFQFIEIILFFIQFLNKKENRILRIYKYILFN